MVTRGVALDRDGPPHDRRPVGNDHRHCHPRLEKDLGFRRMGASSCVGVALLAACTGPTDPGDSSPSPSQRPKALRLSSLPRLSRCRTVTLTDQAGVGARSSDLVRRSHRAGEVLGDLHPLRDRLRCGPRCELLAVVSRFEDERPRYFVPDPHRNHDVALRSGGGVPFRASGRTAAVYFVRNDSPEPLAGCAEEAVGSVAK